MKQKSNYQLRKEHIAEQIACQKEWDREDRLREHKESKIVPRLHSRMNKGIKRSFAGSGDKALWEVLVGYSVEDLKRHLEGLFQLGMTWENMKEWHIDHIIPISKFKGDTLDEKLKGFCGLKNLCPRWAIDNISKGNRVLTNDELRVQAIRSSRRRQIESANDYF